MCLGLSPTIEREEVIPECHTPLPTVRHLLRQLAEGAGICFYLSYNCGSVSVYRVPRVKSHHRKRGGNTRVSYALAYCSTFVAAASRGICLCLSGADSARQPSCRFSKGAAKTADSAVEPSCRFNKGAAPIADSAIKPYCRFSSGAAIKRREVVKRSGQVK